MLMSLSGGLLSLGDVLAASFMLPTAQGYWTGFSHFSLPQPLTCNLSLTKEGNAHEGWHAWHDGHDEHDDELMGCLGDYSVS